MRRSIKILSFICLIWVIFGGLRLSRLLPADSGEYVEKKYAGWSGVLRCWVHSDWQCNGGFIGWLNDCAADFEKAHDGVYIVFEQVSREVMDAPGLHPPQMRILSGGSEVIALGGYVLVENPGGMGTAILPEHCGPMIAMWGEEEIEIEGGGMDLGLPAMVQADAISIDSDAFRRFMNGEIGYTIVDQAQLGQLIRLRDSGRGPDWRCVPRGEYAWCDQTLGLEVLCGGEEADLCREFLDHLCSEKSQLKLKNIGAFSMKYSVYDDLSSWRSMELQLQAKRIFPKGEHSAAVLGNYVRKLASGELTAGQAIEMLAQTNS